MTDMISSRVIAFLAIILLGSFFALWGSAAGISSPPGTNNMSDTMTIAEEIRALDADAQSLLTSVQSAYLDISIVELRSNPNVNLSEAEKTDLLIRIYQIGAAINEYAFQLDEMNSRLIRFSIALDAAGIPEPELSSLRTAITRINYNLAIIQSTIDDVYAIKGRIDYGRL